MSSTAAPPHVDDIEAARDNELDLKRSQTPEEPQRAAANTPKRVPGAWEAFTGADRSRLKPNPIVWRQGFGPWATSVKGRTKSIFTRRFLVCLLAGQFLSLAITSTSVLTTELVTHNWSMPCFQTFFLYFFLNLVYTPFTIYKYGFKAYGKMLYSDAWKYILYAAVDVEANFLVVKAFGYTSLLSCMLLDAWATPACMIFAYFLVKARYHWTQILGVLICIAGLGLLVVSDFITDKDYPANNRVLGDILMLIGATGYGLSNALGERFVRERPLYEVIGQLGLWGTLINGTQGAGLEHRLFRQITWSGENIGYLAGYTCAMLSLYTVAPILYRLSSSPFYNLSILTSDFFGLCFGLGLFGYSPYWLYFVAYPFVIVGLIVYFLVARPEAQGETTVVSRGKQLDREEKTGKVLVVGGSDF